MGGSMYQNMAMSGSNEKKMVNLINNKQKLH